ncbi:MAG: cupredoxin domain-containing protein [Gammaproteobacteria bacterium]|nr:cupredoxin domain-containing protein [Gammaproteobacteria bacterium]
MLGLFVCPNLFAGEPVLTLSIHEHRFEPAEVRVPANTKVKLIVRNLDASPEEFESYELKREKVIPGNSEAAVFVGPLAPGSYPFFGDFNQATAQGRIIVE